MKVLVVGMCPSHKPTLGNKRNATFKKLESWMDKLKIKHFSFVNTFDHPADPSMKKVDYHRLSSLCDEYVHVIALGGFVSNVLDKIGVDHCKMPHPSPLNRQLNDKAYEKQVLKQCKEYLK